MHYRRSAAACTFPRAFQVGGAIGVAIASTVAVSRTSAARQSLAAPAPSLALTDGIRLAFAALIAFALLGVAAGAVLLVRREDRATVAPDAPA
ncbi:MAG: hypothetical protein WAM30_18290 [Candidatus Dormiibacterota bacterium]